VAMTQAVRARTLWSQTQELLPDSGTIPVYFVIPSDLPPTYCVTKEIDSFLGSQERTSVRWTLECSSGLFGINGKYALDVPDHFSHQEPPPDHAAPYRLACR
jgi:hypothetical protein